MTNRNHPDTSQDHRRNGADASQKPNDASNGQPGRGTDQPEMSGEAEPIEQHREGRRQRRKTPRQT